MYSKLKRFIDFWGALIGLILFGPLLLVIALVIGLESGGGVLYQTKRRLGFGGKLFMVYKFRTMVRNADDLLWGNPALLEQYKKTGFKLEDDPRVTRVGRFLRRTGLDELPQLVNVVLGEMSLVGPRPYYPWEFNEVLQTKQYLKDILSVRPGMTGPWQVSDRNREHLNEHSFMDRVTLEATYAKQQSLWYDMFILLKTFLVVFQGRGR